MTHGEPGAFLAWAVSFVGILLILALSPDEPRSELLRFLVRCFSL